MLDQQTKKRIDDCRDILVGKITDPKSQVEQITIALIYKFMDDMDTEAIEDGGVPTFFVGEFERYSWKNIFNPRMGGHEVLNLYGEGMTKMNENPNLPQLFRDIFKNAYLPYRDPETLKLFLKEINGFHYSHSEKLGDAFEYLLSVLGSQGDAGQFRTPRHIIDFIVEIVDPKKNETILDPACGTAGFLISGYKHILKSNTNKKLGDQLSPDEKKKLIGNVVGYDISPDMVRLCLVNLFLHGFTNPKIYEYDTLTSEEKWNEYYDVILANPPFMSPKGGIRPHKRFGIQSSRSEVLFVDYMMEHLTPKGRAGIIVPEGVIFQSGTAYKSLRKTLVEKYLVGVVSLPSGVFQPYSGVKTSILILDRDLSSKTDKIFFGKIESDGFDLGAQRKENDKSDLPKITDGIKKYLNGLRNGKEVECCDLTFVLKSVILGSSDLGLSYERYGVSESYKNSNFNIVDINDYVSYKRGTSITKKDVLEGDVPVIAGGQSPAYFHNQFNRIGETITISSSGAYSGFVNFFNTPIFASDCFTISPIDKSVLNTKFLYILLKSKQKEIYKLQVGGAQPHIYPKSFNGFNIPLPQIEVQEEIIREIEQYQKIIDGANQVVENYNPIIEIDLNWEIVELGEVCEINPKKSELYDVDKDIDVSFLPMSDLNQNNIDFIPKEVKKLSEVVNGYTYFRNDDVLLAKVTPCFENGKGGLSRNLKNGIGFGSSEFYVLRSSEKVLPTWIYFNVCNNEFRRRGKLRMTGTGGLQRVPKDFVDKYRISLPSIEVQKFIIEKIETERQFVEGTKKLIEIYTQKIQDRINKVWGVEETI